MTTIRLGDRFRLFAVVPERTPATLELLDRDDRVLHTVKFDVPPGGIVTKALPQAEGWEKVRLKCGFHEVATNLDPNFGRVLVVGGTRSSGYSMVGVGDEWKGEGPVTDAHWLTDSVRHAIDEAVIETFR